MCPPPDSPNAQANGGTIDPRETRGFQDIDTLVAAFLDGIPRGFKNPVNNNIVDPLLFVVFMVPHVFVAISICEKIIFIYELSQGYYSSS